MSLQPHTNILRYSCLRQLHLQQQENLKMVLNAKKALLPFAGEPNKKELIAIAIPSS